MVKFISQMKYLIIYGFNEELLSNDIIVKSSNEDVVKTNVNTLPIRLV